MRLPAEDSKLEHVGTLLRTLCGTRDAASAWDEFFNNAAIAQGHDTDSDRAQDKTAEAYHAW